METVGEVCYDTETRTRKMDWIKESVETGSSQTDQMKQPDSFLSQKSMIGISVQGSACFFTYLSVRCMAGKYKESNNPYQWEVTEIDRIIAIANQKGGVGKTTTAINLSACLAEAGKKVLVIDLDPQGNTTSGVGGSKDEENTIYDVLIGEKSLKEIILPTQLKGMDLAASNVNLAGAEIELIGIEEKEFILKKQVQQVSSDYDFILIDCPPALSMLTVNALTTATSVLVPIQCEYYALEGLSQLIYTINLVKERLNPSLSIEGVVFTMYDARTNLSLQVVENVKDNLDQHIFKTIIPRNVRLAEAPSYGMPIILYDTKSVGAESYRKLAQEVIKNS